MAPRNQVPTLFDRSKEALTAVLNTTCDEFLNDSISVDTFIACIQLLQQSGNILVSHQPQIAELWLLVARRKEVKYSSSSNTSLTTKLQFLVESLVSVATLFSLKKIKFSECGRLIYTSLLSHLGRLKKLENLDCDGWEVDLVNQKLLDCSPLLTNLTAFEYSRCTDEILVTVCQNCKLLEMLNISGASNVTEDCIEYIARLKYLRILSVGWTAVTEKGLIKLLLTSESENLEDIQGSDEPLDIGTFLGHLKAHVVPFRSFNLRYLRCEAHYHTVPIRFSLIPKYFPHMRQLHFVTDSESMPDFTFLDPLNYLETAHVELYEDFGSVYLNKISSLRSLMITDLTMIVFNDDHDGDDDARNFKIDFFSFLQLGLNCPNLKSIRLQNCSFSNDSGITHVPQNPFQRLEAFEIEESRSTFGIDIVLKQALVIERISLEIKGILTDDFWHGVLQVNPLSKLEVLKLHDFNGTGLCLSNQMLKFIIKNCPRISILEVDIPVSGQLEEVKKFVAENNFNVVFGDGISF